MFSTLAANPWMVISPLAGLVLVAGVLCINLWARRRPPLTAQQRDEIEAERQTFSF